MHLPGADLDTHADGELGVHAPHAVTAARGRVDCPDRFGEHLVAQSALAGQSVAVVAVAALGHSEHTAGGADADSLPGQGRDSREPPFGPIVVSSRIFAASRVARSSSSSCLILLSASRSCADSTVDVPGASPRSTSA